MTRILFYVVFISVLVLGIGVGYNNSCNIYNSNYKSQGIYSTADVDPYKNVYIDLVPLRYDSYSSVNEVPYANLIIDPVPLSLWKI